MKYGFCTGFATTLLWQIERKMIEKIEREGYDYVELPLMSVACLSDGEFNTLSSYFSSFVSCNLFPSNIPLLSKDRDVEEISSYLDLVFSRAQKLGIKEVIFGSGKARSFDSSFTKEEALRELEKLIKEIIIPKATKADITVLLEPLKRDECNIINTVEEAYSLVKTVNDPSFSLMADLYHMENNGEDLSILPHLVNSIEHIHIAGKNRSLVETISSPFILKGLEMLKSANYDKAISFETDWGDIKTSLEWLKAKFNN